MKSMIIENQKNPKGQVNLTKISNQQSTESLDQGVDISSASFQNQNSFIVSQDYPISMKPYMMQNVAVVSPLDISQKSMNSNKAVFPIISNSQSPSRSNLQNQLSPKGHKTAFIKDEGKSLWQNQESGGDIAVLKNQSLDNQNDIKDNREGQTIRINNEQSKFSLTEKKFNNLTSIENLRSQDKEQITKQANQQSQEENLREDSKKQTLRSRNGLRRIHKSSQGGTNQQRKSDGTQRLAYDIDQDRNNEQEKGKEVMCKSQKSMSSCNSSTQDNDYIQLNQKGHGAIKRKKTSNLEQQMEKYQNQKSLEMRPLKDIPQRKTNKKSADRSQAITIQSFQKKEKSNTSKVAFRTNKKINHKKNSKNQLIVVGTSQPREIYETKSQPIDVIQESIVDEEKGTVEQKSDEQYQLGIINPTSSHQNIQRLNTETIQTRFSKENPMATFSDLECQLRLNKNGELFQMNPQGQQLNDSLPYISQNRSSMSSMTCIQPSMHQIVKKNSSDNLIEQEIKLTETFLKHFQSNKMINDQVNLSQMLPVTTSTNLYDKSNTLNTQSFISKQSRNSHTKSNRDKMLADNINNSNFNDGSIFKVDPINISNFKESDQTADFTYIRDKKQAISKILQQKFPLASPNQIRQDSILETETSQRQSNYQHPARSNTPLIVKQKMNIPETRVAVNGLEIIKHANLNTNSQQYAYTQSQGKLNGMSNQKIQSIITGLQRFQNIDKQTSQQIQPIQVQKFSTPQKIHQSKVGSVKVGTPKDREQFMRGHLKQLVVTQNGNHQHSKHIQPNNQMNAIKNMQSPLLNGNNNAYIDNPILKKNQINDQRLLDEANKIIAQRGLISHSLNSINNRQSRLNELQASNNQQSLGQSQVKRLQSSQPHIGQQLKNQSVPGQNLQNVNNRDDHFSPFETFLLNLLQKSNDSMSSNNASRKVPVLSEQHSLAQTKLIPQNIQKLQQFQVANTIKSDSIYATKKQF